MEFGCKIKAYYEMINVFLFLWQVAPAYSELSPANDVFRFYSFLCLHCNFCSLFCRKTKEDERPVAAKIPQTSFLD